MLLEDKLFKQYQEINDILNQNNEKAARDKIILLLNGLKESNQGYDPILNHFIRQVGLYPYMSSENIFWEDSFVKEVFTTDIGADQSVVLHREQSSLLKELLNGNSVAVSAPTSFGKSFIIDAFIKIKQPKNIMIIVPTIALTDETRRRLYKRFSKEYNIITTVDSDLTDKNIFIFPQERALSYINSIKELDILIIDEFYKSSTKFEPDRASSLIKAMIKLGEKAKQKYYLAPNISNIKNNPFTKDMKILKIDFNTVYLQEHFLYKDIHSNEEKEKKFIELSKNITGKTLIFAGTQNNITALGNILIKVVDEKNNKLLNSFSSWLENNYSKEWNLPKLIRKGIGIHTGKIHRALSQLQIKLFEEENGLDKILSTSSIIEGVNTSAENVIVWHVSSRGFSLNSFTYKNVIGRAGRMFRYFIGNIYVLDEPPQNAPTQLEISFPEEILGGLDIHEDKNLLTQNQLKKIYDSDKELSDLLGKEVYLKLKSESAFQSANFEFIKNLAHEIKRKQVWKNLKWLNSSDCNNWDNMLFKVLRVQPGQWGTTYTKFVHFIKTISNNWYVNVENMLQELKSDEITLDLFFELERIVSFNLAALLQDINTLQMVILKDTHNDISPFIKKVAFAFLPPVVYQLEEYGLPRMISKKIHKSGLVNFEQEDLNLKKTLDILKSLGKEKIKNETTTDKFEEYILDYFFDGITAK